MKKKARKTRYINFLPYFSTKTEVQHVRDAMNLITTKCEVDDEVREFCEKVAQSTNPYVDVSKEGVRFIMANRRIIRKIVMSRILSCAMLCLLDNYGIDRNADIRIVCDHNAFGCASYRSKFSSFSDHWFGEWERLCVINDMVDFLIPCKTRYSPDGVFFPRVVLISIETPSCNWQFYDYNWRGLSLPLRNIMRKMPLPITKQNMSKYRIMLHYETGICYDYRLFAHMIGHKIVF